MIENPYCIKCGKRMITTSQQFTVDKKPRYMYRFECACGHVTNWFTEEMLEQVRKLPKEM